MKPVSEAPAAGHPEEIRSAQVRLVYEQAPAALVATLANSAILTALLWSVVPNPLLTAWSLACLIVVTLRLALRRAYFRKPRSAGEAPRWSRLFLAGVAANGALWGFAGYTFFVSQSPVHQLLLAYMLGGMVAGSVATLSPLGYAYSLFLAPTLLPYLVRLLETGDALDQGMAAMVVLFMGMMVIIARRQYLTVLETLRLHYRNLDLLSDLHGANIRQEQINRELAASLKEKHASEEALRRAHEELERRVQERTAELARSEEALRKADRQKDEFLAMLGHELRNPLAPIRNAVEILRRSPQDPDRLNWCRDVIGRQVEHLTRLVDDLLDVSRISRGKIELRMERLDLADIVQRALEASCPLIDARRHELTVQLPAEPVFVAGDRVRLAQTLSNLLNNAAKYTDEGGRIDLTMETLSGQVYIRVRDTGRGIDSATLPSLFDPFFQGERNLDRADGGLGIGLSLVWRLVALHGGEVRVYSEGRGRGSEFVVRLPCLSADAQPRP